MKPTIWGSPTNEGILEHIIMKNEIHPTYHTDCKVFFRGEHVMTVGATVPEMHVDIWSGSHPFYTGKASFVDAAGRVEKFQNKFKGNYFQNKKK
jgi:large subunit ribosomal protein L31|tara:strand:+ start:135 stop:416 length:282 start_codon:yes stop_codon:yes gene_type:complete